MWGEVLTLERQEDDYMDMMFKRSRFNFSYKREEDENVVYNTFSKAIVVFSDLEYERFLRDESDDSIWQALIENGILVRQDFDENAFMKYYHYKTKFSNDTLYLTIAPTLDCNFACPYCYENRRHGKMSPEVQEAVCTFIQEAIESGTQTVDISWYGGEPLLCFDVVDNMSTKIRALCEQNNRKLKMHMVTNGYLLTPQIVERLDELGITRVQITIDGLAEHHDQTRPLRDGRGTFDAIFQNLRLFDDSPIAVVIRMNVDNNNMRDYVEIKKLIEEVGNPNIDLYASPVEDINKDTVNTVSNFMSTDQFEDFAISSCGEGGATSNDFAVMDNRYCFCTAETENCYVVDDQGDFYKCWDEVGRTEYRCFNILNPTEVNYTQIASFVTADPFADDKCCTCVFLPLCFGGCKFQRAHLTKSVCGFTDATLRQYLESKYFQKSDCSTPC